MVLIKNDKKAQFRQQSMLAPEIADNDISNLTFDSEFDDEAEVHARIF